MSFDEPSYFTGAIQPDYFIASCDKACVDFLKDRPHRSLRDLMTKESGELLKDAFERINSGEESVDAILDVECTDQVFRPFHFRFLPSGQEDIVLFTASNIYLSEERFFHMRDLASKFIRHLQEQMSNWPRAAKLRFQEIGAKNRSVMQLLQFFVGLSGKNS